MGSGQGKNIRLNRAFVEVRQWINIDKKPGGLLPANASTPFIDDQDVPYLVPKQ